MCPQGVHHRRLRVHVQTQIAHSAIAVTKLKIVAQTLQLRVLFEFAAQTHRAESANRVENRVAAMLLQQLLETLFAQRADDERRVGLEKIRRAVASREAAIIGDGGDARRRTETFAFLAQFFALEVARATDSLHVIKAHLQLGKLVERRDQITQIVVFDAREIDAELHRQIRFFHRARDIDGGLCALKRRVVTVVTDGQALHARVAESADFAPRDFQIFAPETVGRKRRQHIGGFEFRQKSHHQIFA